jgi:hypothetical protein
VEARKAPSVSAVVNDALEAEWQRDQKARRLWREAAERADPDQIARMLAHVEAQAAQLPASHSACHGGYSSGIVTGQWHALVPCR